MSVAECAAIVERGDPDRFLATMAAPVDARAALFPVYALNVEVTRAAWISSEPMICEMRLQWWRDVLEEISSGQPPRAHEVAEPLTALLRDHPHAVKALDQLIAARSSDVTGEPFEDQAALDRYIEDTAAGLMWASANVIGASESEATAVRDFGWAAGLAAYFRAIPELEARGRRPLVDGRPEAVAELARRGLDRISQARRAGVKKCARPALWAGWRAEATLRRVAKDPSLVARGEVSESEFVRRTALFRRSMLGSW